MKVKVDGKVRILIGTMVLLSFALGFWVHPAWLWLSVLMGVHLIQKAFTGFCPAEKLFRAMASSSRR